MSTDLSSLFSLSKASFLGSEAEWTQIAASASYRISAAGDETVFGQSDAILDYIMASDKEPYGGSVPYADPGYIGGVKRYPIDCKHVKAALSYISQKKNSARYTSAQLAHIKSKIHAAFKRCFGHDAPSTKD